MNIWDFFIKFTENSTYDIYLDREIPYYHLFCFNKAENRSRAAELLLEISVQVTMIVDL